MYLIQKGQKRSKTFSIARIFLFHILTNFISLGTFLKNLMLSYWFIRTDSINLNYRVMIRVFISRPMLNDHHISANRIQWNKNIYFSDLLWTAKEERECPSFLKKKKKLTPNSNEMVLLNLTMDFLNDFFSFHWNKNGKKTYICCPNEICFILCNYSLITVLYHYSDVELFVSSLERKLTLRSNRKLQNYFEIYIYI